MEVIRKAELQDVPAIFEMINHYAAERVMLPRPLTDLYESVREFFVAIGDEENVDGCGALKLYNAELAEVRSLCVAPGIQKRGTGRALTERLIAEAESFGLKTVFALTMAPDFFLKCGFRETARERFPMKVWRDCLRCDRYFHCHEKTVCLDLPTASRESEARSEPAEVPA
ncbi:MAG: N-acetyltransferase [Acidobacteriota bacterium]|nr:N-acetyltransferase [Acidobacteriota bacterium]